jgi:hypothetical protein
VGIEALPTFEKKRWHCKEEALIVKKEQDTITTTALECPRMS